MTTTRPFFVLAPLFIGVLLACGGAGSGSASSADSNTGWVCTGDGAATSSKTTWFGLLETPEASYIVTRTETRYTDPGGRPDIVSIGLNLDDGSTSRVLALGEDGSILQEMSMPSMYSPENYDIALKVAPKVLGDCKPWTIDASKLEAPKAP